MRWDDIKQNPPSNLKISPLAMITHKSRKYRAILDLSFALKVAGWDIPLANKSTKETAPDEDTEKMGTVMTRIIEAPTTDLLYEDPINFSK